MKRILIAVMIVAMLVISASAQAGRLEDISKAYEKLKAERVELMANLAKIDENLIRLEGMFSERQAAIAEQEAAAAEVVEEAVVEEEIIIEETVAEE